MQREHRAVIMLTMMLLVLFHAQVTAEENLIASASTQPVQPLVKTLQGADWAKNLPRPDMQATLAKGFTIKTLEHPRLDFSKDELNQLKQRMSSDPRLGLLVKPLISSARGLLADKSFLIHHAAGLDVTYSLPPRQPEPRPNPVWFTGDIYPYWTEMSRVIQRRMETLAVGYALSGDKKLGRAAIDYALALTEWSTWTNAPVGNGNSGLETAHITMGIAAVYDITFDLLTVDERLKLRKAMVEKGLRFMYADTAQTKDYNKDLLRTSALGLAGLALLDDLPEAELYVKHAYASVMDYLDKRLDSDQTEGLGYTSYALSYIAQFALALQRVTGNRDFLDHPWINTVLPEWITYFLAPKGGSVVNFSDANYEPKFGVIATIASRLQNGLAGWYVWKTGVAGSALDRLMLGNMPLTSPESLKMPASKAFWNIGWVALRSGWENSDHMLAFQSSKSRLLHNQYDQNNFVLNVAGEWLITDPGYKDDGVAKKDVTEATAGHNSLLVDGNGQFQMGVGYLKEFFHSPIYDFTTGEAGSGYSPYGITGWERKILFNRPNYYIVVDRISAAKPVGMEILYHTDEQGKITIGGKDLPIGTTSAATSFHIEKKIRSVDGYIVSPQTVTLTYTNFPGREEYGPFIKVAPAGKVFESTLVTILHPTAVRVAPDFHIEAHTGDDIVRLAVTTGSETEITAINPAHKPGLWDLGNGMAFSADHAALRFGASGSLVAYTLANGTHLSGADRLELVSSPQLITAGVQVVADAVHAVLWAEKPAWVSFYTGTVAADTVTLNGAKMTSDGFSFNPVNRMLTIWVEQGASEVTIGGDAD